MSNFGDAPANLLA